MDFLFHSFLSSQKKKKKKPQQKFKICFLLVQFTSDLE